MNKIIVDCLQGSDNWQSLRIGIPGASCLDQLVSMKGERSAQRTKLLYRLAGERLLGRKEESYSNAAMLRGIELEPVARSVFEMETELDVREVGFVYHDERRRYGCSPDGLIGDLSGLEIKCPSLSVHIEYLIGNKLPAAYFQQVMGCMLSCHASEWYFFSFYPEIKPLCILVKRDEKFCDLLEKEIETFCEELEETVSKLRTML